MSGQIFDNRGSALTTLCKANIRGGPAQRTAQRCDWTGKCCPPPNTSVTLNDALCAARITTLMWRSPRQNSGNIYKTMYGKQGGV